MIILRFLTTFPPWAQALIYLHNKIATGRRCFCGAGASRQACLQIFWLESKCATCPYWPCCAGPGDGKAKVSQVVGARDAGVMGSMSLCQMLAGEKWADGNTGEARTNGMEGAGGRLPWGRGEGKPEAWGFGKKISCTLGLFTCLDFSVARTTVMGHIVNLEAWWSGELAVEWGHLLLIC